jgi:hypothetical protein
MNAWCNGNMPMPSQPLRLRINTPLTIRSDPQA